ncbi:hypothetical protein HKX48_002884 [Thoreauomyces humboldtii]|nr:hypothetical protein HKX48_002884 [Thoreauomyces humboldtii]
MACIKEIAFGTTVGKLNLVTLAASLGSFLLIKTTLSLLLLGYRILLRPATNLARYGAKKGAWAVVTGASDGIGKEFALQLAKAGFNVVLMARTRAKLEAVAAEADAFQVKTMVIPFDFGNAGDAEYLKLKAELAKINVGVLVNNVAVNHEIPISFVEESSTVLSSIVEVDVAAQVRLTRLVLPQMTASKRGWIVNIGSVAGLVPSPYLATYSGSKSFLRTWSRALSVECAPHGVHVEHVKTYFVVTNMSKIRRSNWLTPTAKGYVRAVLRSAGQDADSAPFPSHAVVTWGLENLVPEQVAIKKSADMHVDIRRRALRKREREAAKAKSS